MRRRQTTALLVCAAVAAVAVAAALAASRVVLLNLKGGYANRTLRACAIVHHYTFFHRRQSIAMNGSVSPKPSAATWRVKVKVKRCLTGRFRTVWIGHAAGRSDGTFLIAFRPRSPGFFFARAYDEGVRPAATSDKQYFRVP
jgi:hypothetical protein